MSFIIVTVLALIISICTSSQQLRVEAKPVNGFSVHIRKGPPREFSVAMGASVTLECDAGASPPPTIHWLKNGKRIQQEGEDENRLDDSYPIPANSIIGGGGITVLGGVRSRLYIDCVDAKDEAIYTCVAETPFARNSFSSQMNVIRPTPSPVRRAESAESELLLNAMEEVAALEAGDGQSADSLASSTAGRQSLSAVSQCLREKNAPGGEPVRMQLWSNSVIEQQQKDVLLFCRSNKQRKLQQASSTSPSSSSSTQTTSGASSTSSTTTSSLQPSQSQLDNLSSSQLKPISAALSASEFDLQIQQDLDGGALQIAQANLVRRPAVVSWTGPTGELITPDMKNKYEVLETGDLLIHKLDFDQDMGGYVCTISDDFSSDSIKTFVYPSAPDAPKSKRALLAKFGL